jgi:DNA-binding SARP family transcriptional activator
MADWVSTLGRREGEARTALLHLLGGPFLTAAGRRVDIPEGGKRLLAFVALHRGPVDRRYAAGALWPVVRDERAAGNLRSALWRLKRCSIPLIAAEKSSLALCHEVAVDLWFVNEWANRLIQGSPSEDDLVVRPCGLDALDLLPGWYDDWVLMERERSHQRVLHALEALSSSLISSGRCAEAVDAAMLAVSSEPLRESAQRALIEAHLAQGNWVEGRRRFHAYRRLLLRELGTEPYGVVADLLRQDGDRASSTAPQSAFLPAAVRN